MIKVHHDNVFVPITVLVPSPKHYRVFSSFYSALMGGGNYTLNVCGWTFWLRKDTCVCSVSTCLSLKILCEVSSEGECVCPFEANTKACAVTRTEEVRQTFTDMSELLFTELIQFLHKPGGTSSQREKVRRTNKIVHEGQNGREERLRIRNETEQRSRTPGWTRQKD